MPRKLLPQQRIARLRGGVAHSGILLQTSHLPDSKEATSLTKQGLIFHHCANSIQPHNIESALSTALSQVLDFLTFQT